MNIKIICNYCGFMIEILESDLFSLDNCPICEEKDWTIDKEEISKIVENDLIISMKDSIKQLGNNKVWNIVEEIGRAETRGRYRMLFLNAGGEVPEPEPIIYKDT